jgi:RimJ/RimL family protein N-acetyltransferase
MSSDLQYNLRRVKESDIKILFEWANDELVRSSAINKGAILWDNHLTWLQNKLKSNSILLILERERKPVGQIRFDYDLKEKHWLIDYSIGEENRGKGLGKILVASGIEYLNQFPVVALVKPENTSSIKVFESLNFTNAGVMMVKDQELIQFVKKA